MVRIEYFFTERPYKYLWLRYIQGINLEHHCARSFIGDYDTTFHGFLTSLYNYTLRDSKVYYLCGVANDRIWAHNLHIAFIPAEGESVEIDNEFCRIIIRNARQIRFSAKDIIPNLPQARLKVYSTCRNWQFANYLARHQELLAIPYGQQDSLFGTSSNDQPSLFDYEET